MDDDAIKEIREHASNAERILYDHLNQLFGSYKKAPDDHPVFAALKSIQTIAGLVASDEDEEETTAAAE